MAIHVVVLPVIGDGKTPETAFRPDFGSLDMKGRRWGQASSKLSKDGFQAVWIECDDAAVTKMQGDVSAQHLGEAVKDSDVAAVKGEAFVDAYRAKCVDAEARV